MKNKILLFLLMLISVQSIIISNPSDNINVDSTDTSQDSESGKNCPFKSKALISILTTCCITGWGLYFYARGKIDILKNRANLLFFRTNVSKIEVAKHRIYKRRKEAYIQRLEQELRKYGVEPSEDMVWDFLDEDRQEEDSQQSGDSFIPFLTHSFYL